MARGDTVINGKAINNCLSSRNDTLFYTNEIFDMGLYQFEPDPQEEIVGINDFIAL